MLSTMTLCVAIAGGVAGDHPLPPDNPSGPLLPNSEALHRDHLEQIRTGRAALEQASEFRERTIKELEILERQMNHPGVFTPRMASQSRRDLDGWRMSVEFLK